MRARIAIFCWFGCVLSGMASWSPLQLEMGPSSGASLCDESTDIYGLRLALVGKNANVRGLDISPGRAIVDKDFAGIQFSLVDDVAGNAAGLQIGIFHAKTEGAVRGLQAAVLWCEAETLHGGQVGVFNEAQNAAGIQLGAVNWTGEKFRGLSLGAVSIGDSCSFSAQMGLLWNSLESASSGLQLGLIDRARDFGGIQIGAVNWRKNGGGFQAGIYNDADDIQGLQIGGVSVARSVHGAQLNLLGGGAFEVRGAQVGLVNIAGRDGTLNGEVAGIEIGVLNRLGTIRGAQIGGFNDARSCRGAQIGLINRTAELRGLQLGLLNLSSHGGLPVSPGLNFAF